MSVAGEARRLAFGSPAREAERSRWATVVLVGAICMLPVLLYIPFWHEPFMRDEGLYAATAQKMLDGGIPFRDAFDNKPPLIYVWYALSFLLFGETLWAPRLLVSLMLSVTTLLVYFEGRLLFSHRAGALAAVAFALSMGLTVFETNANTEYFMLLPLVGSLLAFTLAERCDDGRLYALAGALIGVAIMTKETSLFVFVLFVALVAYRVWKERGGAALLSRRFVRPVAWLTAGCAAAGLLIVLPFVLTGTFDDMWEAIVVYTLHYVGRVPWFPNRLVAVLKMPPFLFFLMGPLFMLGALGFWRLVREADASKLIVPGFALAILLGMVGAGRFYHHYNVTMLPAFALALPAGALMIMNMRPAPRRLLLSVAVLSLIPAVALSANTYLQPTPEERHVAKYQHDLPRAEWEVESPALGQWLKERTSPEDSIYNLGFQSEIYFYADRQSPTRFMFDHPFIAGDRYVDWAIDELSADPPKYVVDTAFYELATKLNYYPFGIQNWVKENYDYVGFYYYADVWVLKDETGG